MMDKSLRSVLDPLLKELPGVIGVLVIDYDGVPLYSNGRFDLPLNEIGAYLAISISTTKYAGTLFNQHLSTVLTEYKKSKLYQINFNNKFILAVNLKIQNSYLGEVRRRILKALKKTNIHSEITKL